VLARSNQPTLIGLRRVVARDIERLKAVPLADFGAAVTRLDAVISTIDQLPMLAEVAPPKAALVPATADASRTGLIGFGQRVARTGLQGWDAFVAELGELFRVQRVDHPEALMLSPEQRSIARDALRLQLLNARLNLLARNESLFRADLTRAMRAIERGFDGQTRAVAAASGSLKALLATPLAIELPSLAESLAAVRTARAASDAR
jgi:uroporphyrin-3 C-methyltransferase/uroporphyrinogen III methyltransferase/synthase